MKIRKVYRDGVGFLLLIWAVSCGGGGGAISTTPGEELVASIRILSPHPGRHQRYDSGI